MAKNGLSDSKISTLSKLFPERQQRVEFTQRLIAQSTFNTEVK